ncbi:MAG: LolA family protein [Sphingobacteriales bacterium]|jgi:outer membrane lipoprotein-sorting protein
MRKIIFLCVLALNVQAQDADKLVKDIRAKMAQVNDYKATGKLKTDVSFLKIPVSDIQVYYKKPDRFKVKKDGGISLLPKGGVSVNLNSLMMMDNVTAVNAGESMFQGVKVKVVKLLPLDENSDLILTTLYIDADRLLIYKSVTTTRDNGTYDMQMIYGRYEKYGLPDKVIFSFNTKDYKLPKGVTFEYEPGEKPQQTQDALKNKKGKVEITYSSYAINQGVSEAVFK